MGLDALLPASHQRLLLNRDRRHGGDVWSDQLGIVKPSEEKLVADSWLGGAAQTQSVPFKHNLKVSLEEVVGKAIKSTCDFEGWRRTPRLEDCRLLGSSHVISFAVNFLTCTVVPFL